MPTANLLAFGLASSLKAVQNLMLLKEHGFQGFCHVNANTFIYTVFGLIINFNCLWLSQTGNFPSNAEMDFPINETAHLYKECTARLVCHLHSYFWLGMFYLPLRQLTGIDNLSESFLSGKLNQQVLSSGVDQKNPDQNSTPPPQKYPDEHWLPNLGCCVGFCCVESYDIHLLITITEEFFLWAVFRTILVVVAKWDTEVTFRLNLGIYDYYHKSLCPNYFHSFV